ncbi:MAG: UbiA-like polyprenyltransferase [bacterium]
MIGVLFATAEEARPLLDRGHAERISEVPFVVYRFSGHARVMISGMGMASAREACRALVERHAVREVINAGVCGALADGIDRGRVFTVSSVVDGAQPERACFLHPDHAPGLERRTLVTVQAPVFDPDQRTVMAKAGELVDMEGFAVADVCRERHIPCCLIKGVTDYGDRNGKMDIRQHLDAVSESVADQVLQALGLRVAASGAILPKLLRFTRVEHTLFSLPLLFAGAWLGAGGHCPSLRALALIVLIGGGARTFGMAVNRIADRDIDAKNPRTENRELPAGRLSLFQGYAIAATGLVTYLLGCALLTRTLFMLAFVPLVPLALYSFLKRFTCLCHYGIGLCLALAPLGAFVAVSDRLAFTPEVWLLALFTFGWISGFDIIYALQDVDFDRAHGVRSLPAAWGPVRAQVIAALTHLISAAALVSLWYSAGGVMSGVALLVAVGAMAAAYWQKIPVPVRFFPLSAIAGIAGALVVLMEGLP